MGRGPPSRESYLWTTHPCALNVRFWAVWTATWSGSDGTVGAALPGTTADSSFDVPVAESQAIVSRTR